MVLKKPIVFVTRKLPDVIETRMMELFDTRLNITDRQLSKLELIEAIQDADVLVPTITDQIDASLLAQAGTKFKLIANFGAGIDHIDLHSAKNRGVVVTNTPGVLSEDTADMSMAMILALARRLSEGERFLRAGLWQGWSPNFMLGHRIGGMRLGILGMGRIGQSVAKRAQAFGMSIHYHNRKRVAPEVESQLGATYWESLDQMLARMDVVVIHCPHTPATFHLLSARRLALLQPHAYVVNVARGEIIDETALIRLLVDKKIAGVALDVFEREPVINAKLLALENVVLTPHLGSATLEAREAMGERVILNIKTFIDGHMPPDLVLLSENS